MTSFFYCAIVIFVLGVILFWKRRKILFWKRRKRQITSSAREDLTQNGKEDVCFLDDKNICKASEHLKIQKREKGIETSNSTDDGDACSMSYIHKPIKIIEKDSSIVWSPDVVALPQHRPSGSDANTNNQRKEDLNEELNVTYSGQISANMNSQTKEDLKEELINNYELDKMVLDCLVSTLTLDFSDREEITEASTQTDRNRTLLNILDDRPYDGFTCLANALKNAEDPIFDDLIKKISPMLVEGNVCVSHVKVEKSIEFNDNSIRLYKSFKDIIHGVDSGDIIDKLISADVLKDEDREELQRSRMTCHEQNRLLMTKIIRRGEPAFTAFITALGEEVCHEELVVKIKQTEIDERDKILIQIAQQRRQQRRDKERKNKSRKRELYYKHWKSEDEPFFCTRSTNKVVEMVNKHSIVTIVGRPGAGKTAIARHIALQLHCKGYEIEPVESIGDIFSCVDSSLKQLFILDDPIGVFGLKVSKENDLEDKKEFLVNCLGKNSKLIMTCRYAIYVATSSDSIMRINNVILEDDDNLLNETEKEHIFRKHMGTVSVDCDLSMKSFSDVNFMFPFLCKLFAKERNYQKLGMKFFTHPHDCLLAELDKIKKNNKLFYTALVLCMIRNGKLLKQPPERSFLRDIFDNCGLDLQTPYSAIRDALDQMAMSKSYLILQEETLQEETYYTFIHDSIFEVTAYHYGKNYPEQIMKHLNTDYISQSVQVEGEHQSKSLHIQLKENEYHLLARRIYEDITKIKLYDVFTNKSLKYPPFFDSLKILLNNKPYEEIKDLFLVTKDENKCHHIFSKGQTIISESIKRDKYSEKFSTRIHETLMDKTVAEDDTISYRIRIVSWVIYYGHTSLLQHLIDLVYRTEKSLDMLFGTDITEQTRLLTLASCSGDREMLRVTKQHIKKECLNASMIHESDYKNKDKNKHKCRTPLTFACLGGYRLCISELIEMGAKIQKTDVGEVTPILPAANAFHWDVVDLLIEKGADINYGNFGNSSPLFTLVSWNNLEAVKSLLERGASINKGKSDNTTPLYRAAERGLLDIAQILLNRGADLTLCNTEEKSPLYAAVVNGHIEIVKRLIENGAEVNKCDKDGKSPLYHAAERGLLDIVQILLREGADPTLCNTEEKSPLYAAVVNGHIEIVKRLIENGAEVNKCDTDGKSPLLVASEKGTVEITKLLLNNDAVPNQIDLHGNSPLSVAEINVF